MHAQLFTGFMYIAAAICTWFLRAWKIEELENLGLGDGKGEEGRKEMREREIRDDDAVPRGERLAREGSRVESVKRATKGLWSLQRV